MTSTSAGPSWASARVSASSSSPACVTRMPSAPQSSAYLEKSGLCSSVCQTSHSPARCSLLILPELAVVEHDVRDPHPVPDRREDLGHVLREAAVARDRDHGALAAGRRPCADRRRVGEADRAEQARHQHVLAVARLVVAAEAVGVVADVDGDHRVLGA